MVHYTYCHRALTVYYPYGIALTVHYTYDHSTFIRTGIVRYANESVQEPYIDRTFFVRTP